MLRDFIHQCSVNYRMCLTVSALKSKWSTPCLSTAPPPTAQFGRFQLLRPMRFLSACFGCITDLYARADRVAQHVQFASHVVPTPPATSPPPLLPVPWRRAVVRSLWHAHNILARSAVQLRDTSLVAFGVLMVLSRSIRALPRSSHHDEHSRGISEGAAALESHTGGKLTRCYIPWKMADSLRADARRSSAWTVAIRTRVGQRRRSVVKPTR
jgi:hypothetical protein